MNSKSVNSFWLATIWVGAFVITVSIPIVTMMQHYVESATGLKSIEQISSLYAPYVGTVLTYVFAQKLINESKVTPTFTLVMAIILSLVWNSVVVSTVLHVLWAPISLQEATDQAVAIASKLSWFVAPVMGYYFAKPAIVKLEHSIDSVDRP
ncbi:hypothetical protein F6476_22785 [Pseudomonas umsongensis]|uniref:hypothetical protein n=1 Tax=Pseudomonas umsongensis TaxID=198618 RepID=UPI001248CAFA|nr:hypothetical protein [Pseudomonas umsongensis]QFG31797.1 hypothetical protein F6476_22785 [Pseudomonas umsongensis]